jgi:hypothetical protein
MCLQKSNLCTASSFGVASPAHLLPLAVYRAGIPLSRVHRFVHSPAVYFLSLGVFSRCSLSFLLCLLQLLCSADPFFCGFLSLTTTEVGLWQQRMLRCCRSSSDSSVRLCRGESHSGASLALSPLLRGRLHPRVCPVFSRTHSHSSPAIVCSSYLCFAYAFWQPSHPSQLFSYVVPAFSFILFPLPCITSFPPQASFFVIVSRVHLY